MSVYNSQLDAFDLYHEYSHEHQSKFTDGPVLPALGNALSGSTGAAIANVFTYPLDLIITRLQVQRQLRRGSSQPSDGEYASVFDAAQRIYEKEGISGLYAGCVSDTAKTVADSFLFFLAYNFVRQSRLKSSDGKHHLPVLEELSVGFAAGAFSKFFTTPIGNVVTRLQTASMHPTHDGVQDTQKVTASSITSDIYNEKGYRGFWSGYSASLILTLNPSLTFFFFETFKRGLLPRDQRQKPSAQATFLIAAISKALASSITYPFSLAKTRAQVSSRTVHYDDEEMKESLSMASGGKTVGSKTSRNAAKHTVFSTILEIIRNDGFSALYEGLDGEICKGFLSHGLTMVLKQAVHNAIIKLYYTLATLVKRIPSLEEATASAKSQMQTGIEAARTFNEESVQPATQNITDNASALASRTLETARPVVEGAKNAVQSGMPSVSQSASTGYETLQPAGQSLASKVSSIASSAADVARSATDSARSTAQTSLAQVSETAHKGYEMAQPVRQGVVEKASTAAAGTADVARSVAEGAKSTLLSSVETVTTKAGEGVAAGKSVVGQAAENVAAAKDVAMAIVHADESSHGGKR